LSALRRGVGADEAADVLDLTVLAQQPGDPRGEFAAGVLLRYNEPAVRAAGVPGAGAVGNARDLALLFQEFLHNKRGLWRPEVLADVTGTIRNRLLDPITDAAANRTLGLVVAGDDG